MANSRETHRRWTFKEERHLIALAASQTPLAVIAFEFKRSVASVLRKAAAMGISVTFLDDPRPKIGSKTKGSKITWFDVDQVGETGEYAFRDGVITIRHRHLEIWKRSPDTRFTLVRFLPATSGLQKYGLVQDLDEVNAQDALLKDSRSWSGK